MGGQTFSFSTQVALPMWFYESIPKREYYIVSLCSAQVGTCENGDVADERTWPTEM